MTIFLEIQDPPRDHHFFNFNKKSREIFNSSADHVVTQKVIFHD